VKIRPEEPGDFAEIARVVTAAFGSPAEARLVEAIRASPQYIPSLALVAEIDGAVAGHVMISRTALRDGERRHDIVHLSPLAVAPELQGRGVGSALVREVTTRADEQGLPLVALEGDPRFYARFGFEHSEKYGIHIDLPSWAPPEAAQVLLLRNYDKRIRGRVVYPAAFDTLDERN
jgi:putative acetyltransferase